MQGFQASKNAHEHMVWMHHADLAYDRKNGIAYHPRDESTRYVSMACRRFGWRFGCNLSRSAARLAEGNFVISLRRHRSRLRLHYPA
jgi:hypothetical protein